MNDTATIVELCSRSIDGIYAVPYRSGRSGKPQRLADGAIVELPTAGQRRHAPNSPASCLELAVGGGLATIHHANLGLIAGFLTFEGVYVLSSGDIAAVYGADAVSLS